ncbi:hypothetical protein DGMP_08120 [Desulfomarina profundi]|uniref:Uncharacterized protein n=1 Tax=Desulfomarina profundi TaxID=2772557 RepID=A0A8D5FKY6_9BACT|nr:hypothetical protein [Desulfomarina profundi]BCL60119.1 hypothetical protein DGMP_08120 [Desulfomarina profundi]
MFTGILIKYGPGKISVLITAIVITLSVIITSLSLVVFQGYIDTLGIIICIAAPLLILPVPAKIFFSMLLKLNRTEELLRKKNQDLEREAEKVRTLSGLLPICSSCKKIRDTGGKWNDLESYLDKHSEIQLTHGFCPECVDRLYPSFINNTPAPDQPQSPGQDQQTHVPQDPSSSSGNVEDSREN